jgi:phosphoribosylpyrophosphate synthetase
VIPHCAGGPVQLVFFDIHALQEQFYFTDNVIVQLKSCVRLLRNRLSLLTGERVVIVFPDDGAFKRFHSKFPGLQIVVCHKIRGEGDTRIVDIRASAPPPPPPRPST